jgi:hypothetical protein
VSSANVTSAGGPPHLLAQKLADSFGLLELVEFTHSFLNAFGDR